MSVQASGVQDTRQIDFAAPSALGAAVMGKDDETGLMFFNAVTPNTIIRMTATYPDTDDYEINLVRDGKVTRTIQGGFLDPKLPGPIWTPFPYLVAPGQFQIQMRQKKGTPAALTLYVVYDHPLGE